MAHLAIPPVLSRENPETWRSKKGGTRWQKQEGGTRGKVEVKTGTNHLGFRCVKDAAAKTAAVAKNH
jgi:hypothetical protein